MADPIDTRPENWPHRPCLLRMPASYSFQRRLDNGSSEMLPMNEAGPFSFESDLFVGAAWVRIAGTSDVGPDYFNGRRRRVQAVIQGQFKREFRFSDLLTGQMFQKPLQNMPPSAVIKAVMAIVKRLSPGLRSDLMADKPYSVNILAATVQTMCVSELGSAPDIRSEIQEDVYLLGGHFAEQERATNRQARKKFFSQVNNADKYVYRTDLVYTFDFYQDRLDMAQNLLDFGLWKFDLSRYVNNQPVQIMAQTESGEWLYLFEIWHEKVFQQYMR